MAKRKSKRRSCYRRFAFHKGGQTEKIKSEYTRQLNNILEKQFQRRGEE